MGYAQKDKGRGSFLCFGTLAIHWIQLELGAEVSNLIRRTGSHASRNHGEGSRLNQALTIGSYPAKRRDRNGGYRACK